MKGKQRIMKWLIALLLLCFCIGGQCMAEEQVVSPEEGMRLIAMPRDASAPDSVTAITEAYITCDHTMLKLGEETVWTLHLEGGPAEAYTFEYTLWHRAPTDPVDTYYFYAQEAGTSELSYAAIPADEGVYFVYAIIQDQYGGMLKVASSFYTTEEDALSKKVAEVISLCRNSGASTDLDIALFMHDYLVDHADYDLTYTHYFPEGVLLYGTGTCQSYTTAYKILLDEMGVDCLWVEGTSRDQNHAWNMVRIDGEWYHVDCTWDDPVSSGKSYTYFLIPDEVMAKDHEWNEAAYPECTDTRYVDSAGEQTYAGFTFNGGIGDITITSYTGTETNVVVPATINGRKVKRLAQGCFGNNYTMETLVISEGITRLDSFFAGSCYNLKSISIPSTAELVPFDMGPGFVTGIDGFVTGCPAMESVTVAAGNPYLCVIDNVLYNKSLTELIYYLKQSKQTVVHVPEGVQTIRSDAFAGNRYLKAVILPNSVLSIGYFAFDRCSALEKVNIPANCRSIGQYAFTGTKITEVYIPAATDSIVTPAFPSMMDKIVVDENNPYLYAVDNVLFRRSGILLKYAATKKDKSYTVPAGTKSISFGAFESASNLEEILLPDGLWQIDHSAFWGCSHLRELVLPETVTHIHKYAFQACQSLGKLVIPPSVTYIEYPLFSEDTTYTVIYGEAGSEAEEWAKKYCYSFVNLDDSDVLASGTCGDNLTWKLGSNGVLEISGAGEMTEMPWEAHAGVIKEVHLSEGITSIADFAFFSNRVLETVMLPDSLLSIGKKAFAGCIALSNVDLPQGLERIGDSAFEHCTSLTQIVCPDSVKYMEDGIFSRCSALVNLRLPEKLEEIGDYFCNGCSSLTSISIPKGVENIGICAFNNCSSLANIEIPEAVRKIEREAFSNCSSLVSIEIPEAVRTIGRKTFSNCSSLAKIKIPASVAAIYWQAFAGCTSLSTLIIQGNPTLENDVFKDCNPTVYCIIGSNVETVATEAGLRTKPVELYDFSLPADCVLQTGTTIRMGDRLRYEETDYLTWHISDLAVASIQRNALTAMGVGTATITLSYNGEFIDDMTITVVNEADGHEWDDGIVTIQPDCTNSGLRICHCASCPLQKLDIVESTGHALDEGYITLFPTCTVDGLRDHMCTQCGYRCQVSVPANGHTEFTIPAVPPTCYSTGCTEGKQCSVCGTIIVAPSEVPALGHTEVVIPAVPPTCYSTGCTEGKQCSTCGAILVAQTEVPMLEHSYEEGPIVNIPGCEINGVKLFVCTGCGHSYPEDIPALGHIAGERVVITAPTESMPGLARISCVTCGTTLEEEEIPALGIPRVAGDVNDDGSVDIFDALLILQYDVGWEVELNLSNADVNVDGYVDIFDALMILQYDVGWDVELL